MRLRDKVLLITGGSGGLGSATAVRCAEEGAKAVYVTYFGSAPKADLTARAVNDAGSIGYAVQADVRSKADMVRIAALIKERSGRIDGVACYAGHPMDKEIWLGNFHTLTEEQVRKPLESDLLGSVFTAQAVLPFMLDQKAGSIVLVSSTPGLVGDTAGIPYALAKAAIANLAKCLAKVYGPSGIRINAIAPGSIATAANLAAISGSDYELLANEASLRRFGTPVEVANLAIHLLSDESSFRTGQIAVCDGGTVFR
jgi:NAD(P)-dependent dehydrogenase (short-subunit alcohol dehydrogenase family)